MRTRFGALTWLCCLALGACTIVNKTDEPDATVPSTGTGGGNGVTPADSGAQDTSTAVTADGSGTQIDGSGTQTDAGAVEAGSLGDGATDALAEAEAAVDAATEAEAAAIPYGSVIGSIKIATTTSVPPNASVTVNGAVATINEQGWFSAQNVAVGARAIVSIKAPGYVDFVRKVDVFQNRETFVDVAMVALAQSTSLNASTGGTVEGSGGSSVVIPAGSLQTAAGVTFTGTALVSLTTLDPTTQALGISGDFTGYPSGTNPDAGSGLVAIESFGMVNLVITDTAGQPLTINPTTPLTLQFPANSSLSGTPTTVGLWYFNAALGVWIQTGPATYNTSQSMYVVTVTSTGLWNADQAYATACVHGRVVTREAKPVVAGVTITAAGSTYVGTSTAFTDESGQFTVPVKASTGSRTESVTINAQGGGFYLREPVTVSATPTALMSTGPCKEIGDLVLSPPLARFVLTWGSLPEDLDSHFTGPLPTSTTSTFHVFYEHQDESLVLDGSSVPFVNLDTDDTNSYGPEVTSLFQAVPGTYLFSVHNYSGESEGAIRASGARVQAYLPNENKVYEIGSVTGSVTGEHPVWRVVKFTINANGTFGPLEPVNTLVDAESRSVAEPFDP